jgi:hypothetical protein
MLFSAKEYKAPKDIQRRKKVFKTSPYNLKFCHISKTLNAECLSLSGEKQI